MVQCSCHHDNPKLDVLSPQEATELPLDVTPITTCSQQKPETSDSRNSSSNQEPSVSVLKAPVIPLGTRILKDWYGIPFEGKVVGYNSTIGWYTINYSDGNS